MKSNSNVVLCGAIASYQDYKNRKGIKNASLIVSKSITVSGFVPTPYAHKFDEILLTLCNY